MIPIEYSYCKIWYYLPECKWQIIGSCATKPRANVISANSISDLVFADCIIMGMTDVLRMHVSSESGKY